MPWLLITSGRGPRECQRFAHLMLGEIQRESEQRNLSCELLRATDGEGPQCIQSALIGIDGPEAESFVAGLEGTHKWVCPSPFRPNHGRKNWFIGIKGFCEPEMSAFRENELRVETYRSSGPGGQHANKTSSAVRITHLPTGLVAIAQEERSQHRNRRLALARIQAMIEAGNQAKMEESDQELWLESIQIERGNEVRVYSGDRFQRRP